MSFRLGLALAQADVLMSASTAHVSLSLFDIASEDGLPFHLRVFALRLLMWLVDKNGGIVGAQVSAYAGADGMESLLMR